MKNILITGMNSYLGDSFIKFISQWPDEYKVDTVNLRNNSWKVRSFAGFDTIYHVTGIAHRKETEENADDYFKVNRDLAVDVAEKARNEGVKQFIFLSSGSIYGMETGLITKDTPLEAKTYYGKSKVEAEQALMKLDNDNFKVVILRPLMVYGKNCKGNFQTVIKIVKKTPVFPRVHNKRSLIFVDNLSSFVKMVVDKELSGVYFPKNRDDIDIYDIVKGVADGMGKKIYMSWILGGLVFVFRGCFSSTRKAFTTLTYKETEDFNYCYCVYDTKESIRRSV